MRCVDQSVSCRIPSDEAEGGSSSRRFCVGRFEEVAAEVQCIPMQCAGHLMQLAPPCIHPGYRLRWSGNEDALGQRHKFAMGGGVVGICILFSRGQGKEEERRPLKLLSPYSAYCLQVFGFGSPFFLTYCLSPSVFFANVFTFTTPESKMVANWDRC